MATEDSELSRFLEWWRCDLGRAQCTLEQAVNLYCNTFPGRVGPLLLELVRSKEIKKIIAVGFNPDCMFCAFKDRTAFEALGEPVPTSHEDRHRSVRKLSKDIEE